MFGEMLDDGEYEVFIMKLGRRVLKRELSLVEALTFSRVLSSVSAMAISESSFSWLICGDEFSWSILYFGVGLRSVS